MRNTPVNVQAKVDDRSSARQPAPHVQAAVGIPRQLPVVASRKVGASSGSGTIQRAAEEKGDPVGDGGGYVQVLDPLERLEQEKLKLMLTQLKNIVRYRDMFDERSEERKAIESMLGFVAKLDPTKILSSALKINDYYYKYLQVSNAWEARESARGLNQGAPDYGTCDRS